MPYVPTKTATFNTDTWYAKNKKTAHYQEDVTICECGCAIKNYRSETNMIKHLSRPKHIKLMALKAAKDDNENTDPTPTTTTKKNKISITAASANNAEALLCVEINLGGESADYHYPIHD